MDKENNTALRKLRESVAIAKERQVMNRDEGGYQLSPIYRPLFTAGNYSGSKPALWRSFPAKSQSDEYSPMVDRNCHGM
ncbi:hypothetical protein DPMN_039009 [Dreissena polymorpha]|uniref:Uncharacterized protein n=1 Tax=Dreissena polymorpha TaxID=45954 RepID=A0A9D4MFA4_DREPO|nr:hypothetical protein DPMN_039009 [Dreissena polymorpha]